MSTPNRQAQLPQGSSLACVLLFLWGLSLGMPDVALDVYEVVNFRLDDLFVTIMLVILFFLPAGEWHYTKIQQNYFVIFIPLVGICILSAFVAFLLGVIPSLYRVAQLTGITVTFFTIPIFLRNEQCVKALLWGLMLGGIVYIGSFFNKLIEMQMQLEHYREFKELLHAETWNANTVGNMAITWSAFSFMAANAIFKSKPMRFFFTVNGIFFALIPFIVFTRGAAIGLMTIMCIILFLKRDKWTFIGIFLLLLMIVILYIYIIPYQVYEGAFSDLERDTSLRFHLQELAIKGIQENPLGIGFGNEYDYLDNIIGIVSTHNVFLSSYLELGFLGGTVFLLSVLFWPWQFGKIIRLNQDISEISKYLFALSLGILVMGLAAPGFYFEKPGSPVFAVFLGIIGWLERQQALSPKVANQ